jgi:WD40 repeat protein
VGSPRCEDIPRGDGRDRGHFDRIDLDSKRHPRFLLVCRPNSAELVKHGGEQVEQSFQPLDVLHHAHDLEMQLIHVFGERWTEPALAVLYVQPDLGLSLNHLADLRISEKITDPELVGPLDNEGFVEVGIANLDVLHSKKFSQLAEEPLAVDCEPEAFWIHVWDTHAGVCNVRFPGRFRVDVECDRPDADVRLNLVALPEPALDEVSPDFLAELSPHIVFARTKPAHRDDSQDSSVLAGQSHRRDVRMVMSLTSPMITKFVTERKMHSVRSMITCLPVHSRLRAFLSLLLAVSASVAVRPAALADDPRPLRVLSGHRFEVYSVAFSPDGKTLASGGGYLGPELKPGEIMLWDVDTGKLRESLKGHAGGIWSVAFSPEGKILASGSADKTIWLWDVATGRAMTTFTGHTDWVRSVVFTPDGKTLASAGNLDNIRLWDTSTGRKRATLKGHASPVYCLAVSPDGKLLASNAGDMTVRLWDLATGREVRVLQSPNISYHMAFSPDGKSLGLGGFRGVILWDTATGNARPTFQSGARNIYGVAFSPNGKLLASAEGEGIVRLWDLKTGKDTGGFNHGKPVLSVAFSPDGKLLASGNEATEAFEVKLWEVSQTGKSRSDK